MNFKDKRTRRITAACASAAVVVGGVTVGATLAGAAGSLSLTTGSAVTALDLGQQVTKRVTTLTSAGDVGNWTLTYNGGSAHSFTNAATAAAVQAELNTNDPGIVAAGGVTVTGNPLNAANTLTITFNVPGVRGAFTKSVTTSSITVTNTTAGGDAVAAIANAAFATHISTAPVGNVTLTLDSFTAPTGVTLTGTPGLQYQVQTSNTANGAGPLSGWSGLANAGGSGSTSTAITSPALNDVFITASQPGTYTFHFSDDNNSVGTGDDIVSPTVTMMVLDAENATSGAASDDWSPAVTASPTTSTYGAAITATVPLTGLTLADTRSSNSGVGVLGSKIAALVGVKFTSTTGALNTDIATGTDYTAPRAVTAAASSASLTLPAGKTATTGDVVSTATFDRNGDGTLTDATLGTPASTHVDTNGVTATADPAPTAVVGSVAAGAGANTAVVKTGTAAATYTTTVTDAGTKTDDVVLFTLTPGTHTPGLTANGTLVSNNSGVKVYSVTADANGVATLTVTSDVTTAGTTYTVGAGSNNHNGTNLAVSYADRAASSLKVTSSAASLNVAPTGTVTIAGSLLDQFGGTYVPSGSDTQQAQLFVNTAATNCANPGLGVLTSTAVAQASIATGSVSFSYTPASAPTAGYCTKFAIGYDADKDGSVANTTPERVFGTVTWASTTAASSVTITTPVNNATSVNLSSHATIAPGQAHAIATDFGDASGQITGTVYDSNHTAVAFKNVTITGTPGVYFSMSATPDVNNPLVTTVTTTTTNAGAIGGVYAFFTKPGAGSITVAADTVTQSAAFTTDDSADAYKVVVNPASGAPGDVLIVTGSVMDAFGNPVVGTQVDLSTGVSTIGVLANAAPLTNSAGVFSTTFTTGSNQNGKATLTATLDGQTVNLTPAAGWATAGHHHPADRCLPGDQHDHGRRGHRDAGRPGQARLRRTGDPHGYRPSGCAGCSLREGRHEPLRQGHRGQHHGRLQHSGGRHPDDDVLRQGR